MRKTFSWIAVLLALTGGTATAQLSPTLQITNDSTGLAALSWTNTPSYFGFILQSTTNLSPQIIWNQRSELDRNSTNFLAPMANPQEFFRLAAPLPVFSFAIFYNLNMEITPGQPMLINFPVFSNAGIWAGSAQTTFSNTVMAVGTIDTSGVDPFLSTYSPQGGNPTFLLAGQPVSGVGALNLLNSTNIDPTNAEAILDLPPPDYAMGTTTAYTTNGQAYLANAADLVISNSVNGTNSSSPKGTNLFVYFQDPDATPFLALVTPDYYKLKTGGSTNFVSTNLTAGKDSTTNVFYAGYTFLTNALFYDWREGLNSGRPKAVQAVQIDIALFNIWLTNTAPNGGSYLNANYNFVNISDKGHFIDCIYVYNAVPPTTNTLPAVRVVNGKQLGSAYGLTIATPFPIYVWGDYNTQTPHGSSLGVNATGQNAYPAALMADAITILSDGWNDSTTTLDPFSAANTTVNAAMLVGIVPSNPSVNGVALPGGGGGGTYDGYSGGVENFLRMLEDWGGKTLTYNGSMVAMFPSQYATNYWAGNYYGLPTRHYAFDTNFKQIANLPPLTPIVLNFVSP